MTGLELLLPALASAGATASSAAASAAPAIAAVGTGLGVASAIKESNTQEAIAKAQADEDKQHANAEMVAASQKAQAEERKKEYLLSSQRARFGASGGGTGGTAAEVMGNTEAQGDLNQELQLWQGTERANAYNDSARMKLASAKSESSALPLTIGSKIVSGISGMAKGSVPTYSGDTVIGSDYDPDSGFYTTTTKSGYRYG